jgi:phage terminase large subunit-like protein
MTAAPALAPPPATWSLACPDWRERLRDGRSLVPALPLDAAEAERAVKVFNRLRLPDVEGQPTLGEAAGDWFRDIVRAIFGSLDPQLGFRRVPGVMVLVPKKNSKTTNSAALMLTALLVNKRPNARFALFGPTQEISDLAFNAAAEMTKADPILAQILHVRDHLKTIVNRRSGAQLKVQTFDPSIATGGKYAGWLVDELHLLGSVPYAARVLGQLRGARTSVHEQFGVIITTQSDQPPAGVFRAELQYARAVRDGRIQDPTVLPVLYELPEEIQTDKDQAWQNPKLWPMVTPNLGRSVKLDILVQDFETAKGKGADELQRWASQHLNIEIGLGLHANRWIGADHWPKAADATLTLDTLIERSEVAVLGIDGGGLDDLFGLAVLGRCRETKAWLLWTHAWAHPEVFEQRKEIAARLQDFIADGDLTLCQDATQDIREAADIAERVRDAGLFPESYAVGLDPVGVTAMVDELAAREIEGDLVVAVAQGFRLTGAIKGTERKLKDGTFRHGGRPLMSWVVGNAKSEQRGNAVLITKEAAGKAKIDPLVATFNAVMLMSRNPTAKGVPVSPWEDPEFRISA